MAKNKVLLVVDAQFDFIHGSLKINNAEKKMNKLARFLEERSNDYSKIIFTCDWHPLNHVSFGEWPVHCVQHTIGASIHEPLFRVASSTNSVMVLTKGDKKDAEEYSIIQNEPSGIELLKFIDENNVDEIDVTGIVDMFCVKNTISDLISHGHLDKLRVLTQYVANFNDGSDFLEFLIENNIKFVVE